MFAIVLFSWMMVQTGAGIPQGGPPATAPAASATQVASVSTKPSADADANELLKVKRIYVDSFGDDVISKEMQSMIVSSLVESKRFKVTESRERADAVLKGVALEKTSQELHAFGESTAVGGASGASHGEISGSVVNGNGSISGSSSGGFAARHAATSDSSVNTETINEARVAIRLVNPDGDVIWTSTQESKGAKYKGASADVAEKCVKQLLRDVEKLEHASSPQGTASPTATAPSPNHQ
jgi:curli biogenesis system outer membrane secretion channel CsgG